jgi:hypothetical protein
MGTYNLSIHEIVEAIAKVLDDLEGDFSQEMLFKSLKKCREYPYVSNKIIKDIKWRKFVDG